MKNNRSKKQKTITNNYAQNITNQKQNYSDSA